MLKETEPEETIRLFVTFYHWWHFNSGGEPVLPAPLATPMCQHSLKVRLHTMRSNQNLMSLATWEKLRSV